MKKFITLIVAIGFVLVGCNQDVTNGDAGKTDSTKDRVYSSSWDGKTIFVKQRNNSGDYELVNEITDSGKIKILIEDLRNADWQENVKVDIRPPDYSFTWNSYKHSVWVNQEFERLELKIEGQSNYGALSEDSSETVFEILIGEKLNQTSN